MTFGLEQDDAEVVAKFNAVVSPANVFKYLLRMQQQREK